VPTLRKPPHLATHNKVILTAISTDIQRDIIRQAETIKSPRAARPHFGSDWAAVYIRTWESKLNAHERTAF
jgi:hypothetical protein